MTPTQRQIRDTILTRLRHFTSMLPREEPNPTKGSAVSHLMSSAALPGKIVSDSSMAALSNEIQRLGGELRMVSSENEVATELLRFVRESGYQRIVLSDDLVLAKCELEPKLRTLGALESLITARGNWSAAQLRTALPDCQLGITGCQAILMDTATIVMEHACFGGRSISLLPECHLVVATREQLYETLDDWMGRCEPIRDFPSCTTFVTGPSRTADIEKILILGVHGPLRLVLLIIP